MEAARPGGTALREATPHATTQSTYDDITVDAAHATPLDSAHLTYDDSADDNEHYTEHASVCGSTHASANTTARTTSHLTDGATRTDSTTHRRAGVGEDGDVHTTPHRPGASPSRADTKVDPARALLDKEERLLGYAPVGGTTAPVDLSNVRAKVNSFRHGQRSADFGPNTPPRAPHFLFYGVGSVIW